VRIAIIGAGRVGTALAVHWLHAGHEVAVALHRRSTKEHHDRYLSDTPLIPAGEAAKTAAVVALGVPDTFIEEVCIELAAEGSLKPRQSVLHLSGAMGLSALRAAEEAGASILSVHPLQTFPSVESAIARMRGAPMAVTAEDEEASLLGERLARDAGGQPFRLPDDVRPLYHAAAVFASNYLVTIAAEAESLFGAAGVPEPDRVFIPLSQASLDNVAQMGPEAALTGPVVRGDATTVQRNLEALEASAPDAIRSYVVLADLELEMAARWGRLSADDRAAVEEVLARWR